MVYLTYINYYESSDLSKLNYYNYIITYTYYYHPSKIGEHSPPPKKKKDCLAKLFVEYKLFNCSFCFFTYVYWDYSSKLSKITNSQFPILVPKHGQLID